MSPSIARLVLAAKPRRMAIAFVLALATMLAWSAAGQLADLTAPPRPIIVTNEPTVTMLAIDLPATILAIAAAVGAVGGAMAAWRSGKVLTKATAIEANTNGTVHAAKAAGDAAAAAAAAAEAAMLSRIDALETSLAEAIASRLAAAVRSDQAAADVQAGIAAPPKEGT